MRNSVVHETGPVSCAGGAWVLENLARIFVVRCNRFELKFATLLDCLSDLATVVESSSLGPCWRLSGYDELVQVWRSSEVAGYAIVEDWRFCENIWENLCTLPPPDYCDATGRGSRLQERIRCAFSFRFVCNSGSDIYLAEFIF